MREVMESELLSYLIDSLSKLDFCFAFMNADSDLCLRL